MSNVTLTYDEFYPTPQALIDKMLRGMMYEHVSGVKCNIVRSVLEPSAGRGDIAERIRSHGNGCGKDGLTVDTIEINDDLQHILRGKGFKVVHDDFMTFQPYAKYDLIVMNPPFSSGDKHLLKALGMQKNGGKISCILNAETLRNPYSNDRKTLARLLAQYNAEIEYLQNAFMMSDRKTDVEVALIKICVPEAKRISLIVEGLKREEAYRSERQYERTDIADNDPFRALVQAYGLEVKAGLSLINEYKAMDRIMLPTFDGEGSRIPIMTLLIDTDDFYSSKAPDELEGEFIKKIRYKYWRELLQTKKFGELFTTNLRQAYSEKLDELTGYDFSLFNIRRIRFDMEKLLVRSVEDTIIKLFDDWSSAGYYTGSPNIHYYNGWKTNKSWYIDKRVVIYAPAFDEWSGKYNPETYKVIEKLGDIQKSFNYLDSGRSEDVDLQFALKSAKETGETKKIKTKYFFVTFFKKGTCHLEFRDLELLKKFNLVGSQRKGWLPPGYGKKGYDEMSPEEKAVIDSYEGKDEYNKVLHDLEYYVYRPEKTLALSMSGDKEAT